MTAELPARFNPEGSPADALVCLVSVLPDTSAQQIRTMGLCEATGSIWKH